MQDHILAGDVGLEFALQGHFDGGGHLEPQQSGGHGSGHVGGTDAGGEGAKSAIGTGVGVGTHDDLAGGTQAFLGEQGVLHAHLAYIKEVGDVVLVGEIPGL